MAFALVATGARHLPAAIFFRGAAGNLRPASRHAGEAR
jgi:hypothetical protein